MMKETIICVIIVVLIVSLDIFTQGYTQRATSEITQIFKELKEEMLIENKEQIAFYIPMDEYAKLNEGDSGKLIFKKNRYISFEKEQKDHTDENTKWKIEIAEKYML